VLIVSEFLQIEQFTLGILVWPDEVPRAGTNEEFRIFGVGQVHPVQIIVVITLGSSGQIPVVVLRVHEVSQAHLLQIAHAINPLGFFLCARQRWQQHRGQDRNDRYNYEQFDEGKSAPANTLNLSGERLLRLTENSIHIARDNQNSPGNPEGEFRATHKHDDLFQHFEPPMSKEGLELALT
jgi:hypothetical protein